MQDRKDHFPHILLPKRTRKKLHEATGFQNFVEAGEIKTPIEAKRRIILEYKNEITFRTIQ